MPGHQEVDVVERAAVDRPAEHVDEQQREHHGLDRVGDQQVGLARDPLEVAAREHRRCPTRTGRASSCAGLLGDRRSSLLGSTAAARPVSEMNTSSSVGRRSTMSSMPTPAASSRRTASAITPACCRTGARTTPSSNTGRSTHSSPSALIAALDVAASSSVTSSRSPPICGLELVGRALGDHRAVVDHDDLVGEPVGLVEVLRGQQHGGALRRRGPRSSPTGSAGCAGPGRSSARRGTAPAGGRRARRPGRAGGACRRSRSSPGASRRRSGRTARAARPRARARPRGACGRAARPSRGSRSRSGSRPPRRTGRPGRSWRAARRRRASTSSPTTRAVPASGLSSVVRIRTAVVLPAPLGPSRPEHAARLRGEVDAAEGPHRSVRLLESLDDDRFFRHALEAIGGAAPPMVRLATPSPG